MRRLVPIAMLACVASCSDPKASQVMLILDADERVRMNSSVLVVRVAGGGRDRGSVSLATCDESDECSQVYYEEIPIEMLPAQGLRIALAPDRHDWRRLYEASLTAYPNTVEDEALVTTRVLSGYVRGETRVIRLFVQGSCIGVDCDNPDLTCRGGSCVDPYIPPDELDPFVPPDAATDGGVDAATCANAGDCDDDIPCTVDDCVSGSCQSTPRDDMCTSSNPCSDPVCDVVTGCTTTPNTAPCDDGDMCNGNDRCGGGTCGNVGPELCPAPLTCGVDGTCMGCDGDTPCPGTQTCMEGTCMCDAVPAQTTETACHDMVDNDCNGTTDCDDPNCVDRGTEICDMGVTDEDCDGTTDEDCIELTCANGMDDDTDTFIDCDDDDCAGRSCVRMGQPGSCSSSMPGCCRVSRSECGSTEDWNCDGVAMSICDGGVGDGSPPEGGFDAGFDEGFGDTLDECLMMSEICNNDVDDNCNGLADCEEPGSCEGMPCDMDTGICMGGVCIPDFGDAGLDDGSVTLEVGLGDGGV